MVMAAGLAVTFAYMTHTHPWLREWVLGGTTRELQDALHLPVLFSH